MTKLYPDLCRTGWLVVWSLCLLWITWKTSEHSTLFAEGFAGVLRPPQHCCLWYPQDESTWCSIYSALVISKMRCFPPVTVYHEVLRAPCICSAIRLLVCGCWQQHNQEEGFLWLFLVLCVITWANQSAWAPKLPVSHSCQGLESFYDHLDIFCIKVSQCQCNI